MACGVALVTTDNGGSREYAIHGKTALVAQTADVDILEKYVYRLLIDEARRQDIANAGLKYVERFDWDRSGQILEEVLLTYLEGP